MKKPMHYSEMSYEEQTYCDGGSKMPWWGWVIIGVVSATAIIGTTVCLLRNPKPVPDSEDFGDFTTLVSDKYGSGTMVPLSDNAGCLKLISNGNLTSERVSFCGQDFLVFKPKP